MPPASDIRKMAFLGDYLPRKCGIATFSCNVLSAVATEHPEIECFAVPVNDLKGVEYTRGALLHGHELIIPYAMSDSATSFATVRLDDLLARME